VALCHVDPLFGPSLPPALRLSHLCASPPLRLLPLRISHLCASPTSAPLPPLRSPACASRRDLDSNRDSSPGGRHIRTPYHAHGQRGPARSRHQDAHATSSNGWARTAHRVQQPGDMMRAAPARDAAGDHLGGGGGRGLKSRWVRIPDSGGFASCAAAAMYIWCAMGRGLAVGVVAAAGAWERCRGGRGAEVGDAQR